MAKKKRSTKDMFSKQKGTEMTIRVEAGLLHTLDAYRDDVEKLTGVQLTRQAVLEGLLRKVWWDKIQEASVLEKGGKLSRHFGDDK